MENLQDKSSCLGRLERCCTTLNYFKSKINSYLHEPTTKALFETKEYLREKINALVNANESLLDYLKLTRELLPDQYQRVHFHIKETSELEGDVMEYTNRSKK